MNPTFNQDDRVKTEHGDGVIVLCHIHDYSHRHYCYRVKLDKPDKYGNVEIDKYPGDLELIKQVNDMARKFILGDVVSVRDGDEATVTYVGTNFLKTSKGWLCIEYTVLIRPFNKLYKVSWLCSFRQGRQAP